MKIAHLILAHNKPEQLCRLVNRLAHPDVYVFIHIDKKADIVPFQKLLKEANNVIFVTNRIDIIWGSYRMVQATIEGFKQILAFPVSFDYINLLSGQDYPLTSPNDFLAFLEQHPDKAFMETQDVFSVWKEAIPRLTKYHLVNLRIPGKYQFEKIINRIVPSRKIPEGMSWVGRSQWFIFKPIHAAYCIATLSKYPSLQRFFKYTWGSDEFVFQTLLYNAEFKKDIVNKNYRYIDWSEGEPNPKILRITDFLSIKESNTFFARKFDQDLDPIILDEIDKRLLGL
ncbi:MAG: beta-1,6-N-acetylglucosaminyltransferase [Chitinophagaceae bacterium]|nr:beta-1,6-N-acetylglucosaminyltransferase [Chitinophagaceae bacterium]